MDPHLQTAVDYITSQRAAGISDEAIQTTLIGAGWPQQYVTDAFTHLWQPAPATFPEAPAAVPTQNPASKSTEVRQKYTLRAGVKDVYRGMKTNWLTYLICVAGLIVASIILIFILALILTPLFMHDPSIFSSLVPSLTLIIGLYIFFVIITSLVNAMSINLMSLSLRDGLEGHRGKPLATLKQATSKLIRVALSNALVSVVSAGPLVIGSVVLVAVAIHRASQFGGSALGNIGTLGLGTLVVLGGITWLLIAMLRYGLVPYVALMEPQVPLLRTLKRSSTLLRKGGQWYIFKGILVLVVTLIVFALISGKTINELNNGGGGAVFTALDVIVSLIANGALYTLYRNRVGVKG